MGKEEHSSTAGKITNWYNHFRNQSRGSSENLEIVIPEDSAMPLLGIYPKDAALFHKDICSNSVHISLIPEAGNNTDVPQQKQKM